MGNRGSKGETKEENPPTALYCLARSNYYSDSTTVPSLPASVGKGKCTSLSQSRHLNVPVRPPNPAMGRVQMLKRGGGAPGTPHDYDIDGHPDDTLSRAHASPPKCLLPAAFCERGGA